jgi:hypothetical protein
VNSNEKEKWDSPRRKREKIAETNRAVGVYSAKGQMPKIQFPDQKKQKLLCWDWKDLHVCVVYLAVLEGLLAQPDREDGVGETLSRWWKDLPFGYGSREKQMMSKNPVSPKNHG